MKITAWGQTDVGLKRDANQDSILVSEAMGLFVVADGMGGHKGGEVASAMAADVVQEVIEDNNQRDVKLPPREVIVKAYKEASARIFDKASRENPELSGMGTTMVLAMVDGEQIYFGNVGDSRVYLFRDGKLWQITEDHSLINEQIRAGADPNDVAGLSNRNVITRSVGFETEVEVDVLVRKPEPGDLYLLCSDGLSSMVPNEKIQTLCATENLRDLVHSCIEEAKDRGGDDNISVIVFRVN